MLGHDIDCRPEQENMYQQGAPSQIASSAAAGSSAPVFGMQQVLELYRNTLKLASENKITKDNTWALGLIDHMSDLVKPSEEEQGQTNFQKASCTLDAGVKIYSYRVDSVHNSIYKTLGGLSRTAGPTQEEDQEQGTRRPHSISYLSSKSTHSGGQLILKHSHLCTDICAIFDHGSNACNADSLQHAQMAAIQETVMRLDPSEEEQQDQTRQQTLQLPWSPMWRI